MWISFLEGVVQLVRRAHDGRDRARHPSGSRTLPTRDLSELAVARHRRIRRRLAELAAKAAQLRPRRARARPPRRRLDRSPTLCQPLPGRAARDARRAGQLGDRPAPDARLRVRRSRRSCGPTTTPPCRWSGATCCSSSRRLGLVSVFVGVRVGDVYERTRELGGRRRAQSGAGTTGRSRATSRWARWTGRCGSGSTPARWSSACTRSPATPRSPTRSIRLGFRLVRGHERRMFLDSTRRRMRTFVQLGLDEDGGAVATIGRAAGELTARRSDAAGAANLQLARNSERQER